MRVEVTNHQSGKTKLYEGTPHYVLQLLFFDYPWLRPTDPANDDSTFDDFIEHLNSTQNYDAEIEGNPLAKAEIGSIQSLLRHPAVEIQAGGSLYRDPTFDAARFLVGALPATREEVRAALKRYAFDANKAALFTYGMEPNEENLKALNGMMLLREEASEGSIPEEKRAQATVVSTPYQEAEDVKESVKRAYKDSFVFELVLHGKHGHGALLARDEATHSAWLLKPGSGGMSIGGADEDQASQSQREAAWYHAAKEWGLYKWFPRAELLMIDGKAFAAIQFLAGSWKTLESRDKVDPGFAKKVLTPLLTDGIVHQVAFMDAILGNGDDHGNNCMVNDDGDVFFIDHGSAFAGKSFSPADDSASFVPFALRAFGGQPRVDEKTASRLGEWAQGLSEGVLSAICERYGVDPRPSLARLKAFKVGLADSHFDVLVNQFFAASQS